MGQNKHHICMVSDFFFPNMGGVETSIFQLSQCLLAQGHKVIVVTHSYGDCIGIRYLHNRLKVYYLPFAEMYNKSILPTIYATTPAFRTIYAVEDIHIVHGHSAFSTICHEALLHAKTMGLKTVFTDHSLFGFADISSILTNKLLEFTLTEVDSVICVSHTSKENTVLRASLHPNIVYVIPNAVDSNLFTPDPMKKHHGKITIVVVSRLVYRKGTDLLAGIIPTLCKKYAQVQFLIAGDGPKRVVIEELREKHGLMDRIKMIGEINHNQVRDVLVQGDIFINTSLTEAFCMAIVEAACCGLQVVSTNVGGVFEVLPPGTIYLSQPSIKDLLRVVEVAIIDNMKGNFKDAYELHDIVKKIYTWPNVATRTEKIYNEIAQKVNMTSMERMSRYEGRAGFAGKVYVLIILIDLFIFAFLQWFFPIKRKK